VVAPDATRVRILRVALELFAEQGFAATSTRELAERLGFTKAALYYHFRTKDDLLSALVEPVVSELASLVDGAVISPSAAARRAILAGYVDIGARHLGLLRVLTQDPSVTRRPASVSHEQLRTRMTQLLSGCEAPDTTARTRARAALGAVRAGLLQADADDDPAAVRTSTLAAACGALGIAGPRCSRPPR